MKKHETTNQFFDSIREFSAFGTTTLESTTELPITGSDLATLVPTFTNESWTSKQRAANPLHEIPYRACFKPQLPRFFIEAFTDPGDTVIDPFMGRGTTVLEAALLGRVGIGKDISPISAAVTEPRLSPPTLQEVVDRLDTYQLDSPVAAPEELLVFYHPDTLRQICNLRQHFLDSADGLDNLDRWIRMVAMSRLTGHSPGFFSVYTLPPNQAVSVERQAKINRDRDQSPTRRDVRAIIIKKTKSLLARFTQSDRCRLTEAAHLHRVPCGDSGDFSSTDRESVSLLVTSPPFLDVVDYAGDNWLRCWFLGVDPDAVPISIMKTVGAWTKEMTRVLTAVRPTLKIGGVVAFEVGEVRNGSVQLEKHAAVAGHNAGFNIEGIVVNKQDFTKTANCWGVDNNKKGTNSNRIVVMTRRD